MEQPNAPDDLQSIPVIMSSVARVKYNIPTTCIKMTRNSRSRRDAYLQKYLPDRAEIKMASGNKSEYGQKKY
eukprot:358985-Pyramimonas_sp.AAC.1